MKWSGAIAALLLVSCSNGQLEPENQAKYEKALALYASQKTADALVLLEQIEADEPEFEAASLMIGKIYYYGDNKEEAARVFERLRRRSDSVNVRLWHARSLAAQKKSEEALREVDDALREDSGNIDLWILKGELLENSGDVGGAIEAYQAASAEGQKASLAHIRLAGLYRQSGLLQPAELHLERAAAISNNHPSIREAIDGIRAEPGSTQGTGTAR